MEGGTPGMVLKTAGINYGTIHLGGGANAPETPRPSVGQSQTPAAFYWTKSEA